jgi:hypothetical protein
MQRRDRPSRSPAGPCSARAENRFDPATSPCGRPRHRELSGATPGDLPEGSPRRGGLVATRYGVHRDSRVDPPAPRGARAIPRTIPAAALPRRGGLPRDGGITRASSWDIGFPTALRTFPGTLSRTGSSSRTVARAARVWVSTRPRDPPDLRCHLARHLPSLSVQPVSRLDCLSWVSKERPSVVLATSESTPGENPCGTRLRATPATASPRSVLVVFHHLDGFLLRDRTRVLQRAPDHGVHPVSEPRPEVALRPRSLPGMLPCPSKPSHRPQHHSRHQRVATLFTASLASSSFASPSPTPSRTTERKRLGGTSRPSSTNGSVADPAVSRRARPVLPWACPDPPRLRTANGGGRGFRGDVKDRFPTP